MERGLRLILTAIVIGMIGYAAFTSNRQDPNTIVTLVRPVSSFHFVGDGHYRILPLLGDQPILVKQTRDGDSAEIRVFNTSSDDSTSILEPIEFEAEIETDQGEVSLSLLSIPGANGSKITIPAQLDDFPLQFSITPDGRQSFFATDHRLWVMDQTSNNLKQLSNNAYNGISYKDLAQVDETLSGLYWNSDLRPSPDSTKLVYISNKATPHISEKMSGNSLFVYDLTTGKESRITHTDGASYAIEGWLSSDQLLCHKTLNSITTMVIVSLSGEELELEGTAKVTHLNDVQKQYVAYFAENKVDQLQFAKIGPTGKLEEIRTASLLGNIKQRSGNTGFNASGTHFATIYTTDTDSSTRYIQVMDVMTGHITDIKTFPDGISSTASYLEVSWVNDSTLLLTVKETSFGTSKLTSWFYAL